MKNFGRYLLFALSYCGVLIASNAIAGFLALWLFDGPTISKVLEKAGSTSLMILALLLLPALAIINLVIDLAPERIVGVWLILIHSALMLLPASGNLAEPLVNAVNKANFGLLSIWAVINIFRHYKRRHSKGTIGAMPVTHD